MLVFLLYTLIIIITIILISLFTIYFLKIKIEIEELKINYENPRYNNVLKFKSNIKGFLFGFIKIFNIKLDEKQIKKYMEKERINKLYHKILNNKKLDIKKIHIAKNYIETYKTKYKQNPIKIKSINLELELGFINLEITTKAVVILSTFISILATATSNKNLKYKIHGQYNKNKIINLNLKFNSIITIELKHIINILFKLMIGRRKENDRKSSNRRLNEYCYEQY